MRDPTSQHPERLTDGNPGSVYRFQHLVVMLATGLGVYLCYLLAVPFLPPLVWSVALAVVFAPFHGWLEVRLRQPGAAALVAALAVGCLVVIPATFIGQNVVQQAVKGAEIIEAKVQSGEWRRALEAQPRLVQAANQLERRFDLPGLAKSFTGWLSTTAGSLVKGSFLQALDFCLTFYLLFFFLRDRKAALAALRCISPLPPRETERLLHRVGDTVHAAVYGTLAVSSAQGLLGGLMFWWLGLPSPLLWGVVMALLAVIPVLGAFIVWIPAAIYLALEGSWGKALILTLWGMLVVGTIDNLLRPILVGNRLKLHTVLAFLSVVGGIIVFGPVGILLGPVALTITSALLETWPGQPLAPSQDLAEPDPVARFEGEGGPVLPESRRR